MDNQAVLVCIAGLAAGLGLYAGKLARRVRLPSLIGYMVLGAVIGISGLKLLDAERLESMAFLTKVALGFVAFAIGSELHLGWLKQQGVGVVAIILAESFGAFLVVFAGVLLVTGDVPMALLYAAVAPASAPAGTVSVIQEYRARGPLTKVLYAVVGFDDALAIGIYAVAAAVARSLLAAAAGRESGGMELVLSAGEEIGASLLIGGACGAAFNALAPRLKNPAEVLILTFGVVGVCVGLSEMYHASLILSNMVIGLILANTRNEDTLRRLTSPLQGLMPLVFVLFFALAGAHLDLAVLPAIGLVGVVYIVCRTVGLVGGSRLGAMLGRMDRKISANVGLGILSQAGVAIGLSLVARDQMAAIGSPEALRIGSQLIVSITATSIVFEIIGPVLTKVALRRAGEIGQEGA